MIELKQRATAISTEGRREWNDFGAFLRDSIHIKTDSDNKLGDRL